jgi:2-polyprenyl-3-methyl-5-hydroxy-6-metoxy-1,4-benzoquinol methylase
MTETIIGKKNFIGFDKYTSLGAYHWDAIKINEEYRSQSKIIIDEAVENKVKTVLDIGCGDGAICGAIANLLPESQIYGFDAEEDAIVCGNRKINDFKIQNVSLNQFTIEESKGFYDGKTFEMIFSLDVIEHLPNPNEMIDFIRQISTKDTKTILIGTPLYISDELVSPYHVKEYTKDEIRNIIGSENILKEWILSGKRRPSNNRSNKKTYEESYYICKLSFEN